jgi:hypothetical protein
MTDQWGVILEVSTSNIGEFLTAAAAISATQIVVSDSRIFNEKGGQLTLNGVVYIYTAVDPVTETITLFEPLEAAAAVDDRVELQPAAPVKRALVDLGTEESEGVWAIIPHNLAAVLADGLRTTGQGESALIEERISGELYVKDIPARAKVPLQSSNYYEGQFGFRLDENRAQIQNLNVLEEVGVDTLTARSVTVNGIDLETEFIGLAPLGIVAYDIDQTGVNTGSTSGTTELKCYEYAMGPTQDDRLYRVVCQGHLQNTVADDTFDVHIRYTIDGSTPGITSPLIRTARVNGGPSGSGSNDFKIEKVFTVGGGADDVRFCVSIQRAAGTGAGLIYGLASQRYFVMYVEDLGLYGPARDAGTLSKKSVASGSPGGTPIVTRTKTYWATWSASYRSSTFSPAYAKIPDTTRLYQGVSVPNNYGNRRSLFGLDYATIQADLAGATIKSVKITYRVQAAIGADGMTAYLSSHNHTSEPSTFNPANVDNDIAHWANRKEGSTYTQTLANSVGDQLKAGTKRGFGFGPAPTSNHDLYYGFMYGAGASRPRITISYSK